MIFPEKSGINGWNASSDPVSFCGRRETILLTQMDREMLPAWVCSSEKSVRCFQWLSRKSDTMLKLDGQILRTVKKRMFYFLYCRKEGGVERHTGIGTGWKLAGILNGSTWELTDVAPILYRIMELPETMRFRDKERAEEIVSRKANRLLFYHLEYRPEVFCQFGRRILPTIDRREMEERAEVYFRHEMAPKDIRYIPAYHFGERTGSFTMQVYLLYLQDEERLVYAVAKQWFRKFGAEMYRQKIIYGCIQEELLARKKKKENQGN